MWTEGESLSNPNLILQVFVILAIWKKLEGEGETEGETERQ
jgi:hypothetical protein